MRKRGIVLLLGSVILSGSILAVLTWWLLRPSAVVAGAVEKVAAADSHAFTARLGITNSQASTGALGEQASVSLEAVGAYDRRAEQSDALQATITAELETESVTMTTEVESRFIDDAAYLLIKKMPPAVSPLSTLKGQWLRLPREGNREAGSVPKDERLFTDISRAGRIEIDDEQVRVYSATATPAAVLHLFDSIGALVGNRLTAEQVDQFRQSVAAAEGIPVRLAIKPLTRELKQVEALFTAPGNQNEIHFTLNLTDRNKEVAITAPEGAKSIEELAAEQAPAAAEQQPQAEQEPEPVEQPVTSE